MKTFAILFFSLSIFQQSIFPGDINSPCLGIEEAPMSICGTGHYYRYIALAECYLANDLTDKGIHLTSFGVGDIDGQFLLGQSWAFEFLLKFYEKKYTLIEIKKGLDVANLSLESVEVYSETIDLNNNFSFPQPEKWDQLLVPKIQIFDQEYKIVSTIESYKSDQVLLAGLYEGTISDEDLKDYFWKRWLDSVLYVELSNLIK